MTKEERHILIERYFEAETSAEEERKLRDVLLKLPFPDAEEREALAVMGYASVIPMSNNHASETSSKSYLRNVSFGKRMMQYAAVAGGLIVIAAGIAAVWNARLQEQSRCIAYVGGVEITDESHVMDIVSSQLAEISEISAEMNSEISGDFNEIRNALKMEEI